MHTQEAGASFLTTVLATFQDPAHLFFLMELISGGDLMNMIMTKGAFSARAIQFYVAEISLGLWFMHGKGVIYRDLKLDNIMVDGEGV